MKWNVKNHGEIKKEVKEVTQSGSPWLRVMLNE